MKIANINLIKFFLILLILGIQTPAFSEEVEPEFDLNQFLSTLSGVYVSIDKPSVIVSIHVNANDNSIVVIDVSGTLDFLRDIWYISEEEYEQNLAVSPMERGFIGKFQTEEQIYIGGQKNYIPDVIYAGLNSIVPEQERSSKNSIGLQSLISHILEKSFMEMFFLVDITNPNQTIGVFRDTGVIYNSFGYRNGFVKIF
jgi:hypothetical protein